MQAQQSQALCFATQGAQSLKPDMSMSAVTGEPPMRGVIRGIVASSGSGCEAVLMSHSTSGQPPCWTTRYIPSDRWNKPNAIPFSVPRGGFLRLPGLVQRTAVILRL